MKNRYRTTSQINFFYALFDRSIFEYLADPRNVYFQRQAAKYICFCDALKAKGYQVLARGVEYIYKLEACGFCYVGSSNDPARRYLQHVTNCSGGSAAVLIDAAIRSGIAPEMTMIDICDSNSVLAVEGFWIHRLVCINSMTNEAQYEQFVECPGEYRSAIANETLGVPVEFEMRPPEPNRLVPIAVSPNGSPIPPWLTEKQ